MDVERQYDSNQGLQYSSMASNKRSTSKTNERQVKTSFEL